MKTRLTLSVLAAAAALTLAAPAMAQTVLPPPGSYGQADSRQDQIEALQRQLQEATAENERLQRDLNQAQRDNARLQAMVNDLTAANAASTTAPAAATPAPSSPAAASTPRQTGQLGTMPASALPGDAGAAYSRARTLLNAGNYAEAEAAFAEFLRVHGDANTAPDALYWYAYALLARNNYSDAASNFVTYLRRYPEGPRAPDSQVRLGVALAGMGDTTRACAAFNLVPRRYPRAAAAVRTDAANRARELRCPAA